MKLLKDILYRAGIDEIIGSTNIAVEQICFDSREAGKFSLFVAVKGVASDGHQFIPDVIRNGAAAIVCEQLPDLLAEGVTYVKVKDSRKALGNIASNYYDHPSSRIKLIGITGTNGKTTVATCLYELFMRLGYSCGLISTVRNKINHEEIFATHTTPDAVTLNRLLFQMVEKKCSYAFMEVSSHALDQGRVEGVEFRGAIFTNLTHDHLDYHKTFDHYLKSKKRLFDGLKENAFALVNADDKNGKVMLQNTKAKKFTYSLRSPSDYKARIVENVISGLHLNMDGTEVHTQLVGEFNAYNLLAIYGAGVILGVDRMNVLTTLSTLHPVEGRFQIVRGYDGLTGIVDYAHTPDALENVLKTIRGIVRNDQKIITVIGCGGNRDKAKRPVMAKAAARASDRVILTSDNPRDERPEDIIKEMKDGLSAEDLTRTISIPDRREAIQTAVHLAQKNDVILVAGKGHEKYQETAGVKIHFDDVEELMNIFNGQAKKSD